MIVGCMIIMEKSSWKKMSPSIMNLVYIWISSNKHFILQIVMRAVRGDNSSLASWVLLRSWNWLRRMSGLWRPFERNSAGLVKKHFNVLIVDFFFHLMRSRIFPNCYFSVFEGICFSRSQLSRDSVLIKEIPTCITTKEVKQREGIVILNILKVSLDFWNKTYCHRI